MAYTYYLSDYAYDNLVEKATELGYIQKNAIRKAGISTFINRMSYLEYVDTRPDSVRETHARMLQVSTHPVWTIGGGERKSPRMLSINQQAIENFVTLGVLHGVIITIPLVNRGKLQRTVEALAALTIEAIGIGWLTETSSVEENIKEDKYGTIPGMAKIARIAANDTQLSQESSLSHYFGRSTSRTKKSN